MMIGTHRQIRSAVRDAMRTTIGNYASRNFEVPMVQAVIHEQATPLERRNRLDT